MIFRVRSSIGRPALIALAVACVALVGPRAFAQDPALADFFGFNGLEVIKIDRDAGPISVADLNGDGLTDLIAANNYASRIELHYQKKNASPDDEVTTPPGPNQFPEHWRFRREMISVTSQVAGVVAHDFDGDGLLDLIYGGMPAEIVFLRQSAPGIFTITRKHPVKNLNANRDALAVADVLGGKAPELLSIVEGEVNIWPLTGDNLGQPTVLAAGESLVAFKIADFNGDGRLDIAGVIPEDAAPVRLWLNATENGRGKFGAQHRFEMPSLRELEILPLPAEAAARLAAIERVSKRIVLYQLNAEPVERSGDRDAAISVFSFTDSGNDKRDTAVTDVDGDGLLDLVATDTEANSVVVYRQIQGRGLQAGESYPSLSDLDFLAAGNVDDDQYAELFVMSEKEGVVGRVEVSADGLPFPKPLNIPDGNTPVAMNLVQLEHGPHVAVVAKSGRDYMLYLIDMKGERQAISLGQQSRSPQAILGLDADQDGRTDLLLLTRDKPMTMIRATGAEGAESFKLMESKDMGQFGLVQAASADNTAVMDADGNGKAELLIADKNYVRAVRYETEPAAGVSPGWQVVRQINADDPSAKLVSVALLGERIVAADSENSRLIVMAQVAPETAAEGEAPQPPSWQQVEALNVRGFKFTRIRSGAFGGDSHEGILAIGADGFAVIRLSGERVTLDQFAAWRTDSPRRFQHELTTGDINGDGFMDMLSLDAGEQMVEIFTFTESDRMLYATGFEAFESKLFSGGEPREYQPSECLIADVTGDGANDLLLLAHDRVLLYPQMTKESAASGTP